MNNLPIESSHRLIKSGPGAAAHAALLLVGTAFLLVTAFHGNVWFDESYSVGMASKSFADIWAIGANDVHPVLFYWALHVVYLVFGESVLAYRLFTVAGAIAMAMLGLTHVRRDFGVGAGVLFSFFSLFTPYIALMAVEIRMYSWATFSVSLCFICAMRIVRAMRGAPSLRAARIPRGWWALFFAMSLASAYLHYFGAMAAFMINVVVLVRLAACGRAGRGALGVWFVGALAQIVAYVPWLVQLAGQLGVVSDTYWANFVFPLTLIELMSYFFLTSPVSFAARGAYGSALLVATNALCVALAALSVALLAYALWRGVRSRRAGGACESVPRHPEWLSACASGVVVYAGVLAMGLAASAAMDSLIVYYRYMVVAIGPLILAVSVLLSHVRSRVLVGSLCGVVLVFSCVNQALLAHDDYSARNADPLNYFEKTVGELNAERAADQGAEGSGASGPVLVMSSDIGIEGVTAVTFPQVSQVYLDWQRGNWAAAYQSYAPTLSSAKTWDAALEGYTGRFIVLGQTPTGGTPRDIGDLEERPDVDLVRERVFWRPYERTFFTVAVMERAG